MAWKELIPGCFGEQDFIFANHPLDEQRAFKLLTVLFDQHVSFDEVAKAIVEFLQSKGANGEHVGQQIKRVRDRYKVWLA